MHFLTLAILEIPEVREDKELDKQIVEALKELELQKQIETKNFMLDFYDWEVSKPSVIIFPCSK